MKVLAVLVVTLIGTGIVFADNVSVKAKTGAYYLESQEESVDQSIFQYHSLNASLKKNGFSAYLSGAYSDIYKTRGSEYKNDYRLSIAKAGYTTEQKELSLFAGRMYKPMLDRTAWWDGMELTYRMKNTLEISALGGFTVPTLYEDDFMHTKTDFMTMGGALSFTGVKNLNVTADYLKSSEQDDGIVGVGAAMSVAERYDVYAMSNWDFNDEAIEHINVSTDVKVRKNDKALLAYSFDDAEQDTTRYFDVLLHPTSHLVQLGYYYNHNSDIQAALNYGLLLVDDETGHMVDVRADAYGAYLQYTFETQSYSSMQEITAGYGREVIQYLYAGINSGLMLYKLSDANDDRTSIFASVDCEYTVMKGLSVEVEYEYLKNHKYSMDNRIFVGLTYAFNKGL